MKAIYWTIAAATLTFVQPAQAAAMDPEVIIYRFSGVRDDAGAGFTGIATVFHCTNFSGVPETIRFATRFSNAVLGGNITFPINHLSTLSVSTKLVQAYPAQSIATGQVTGTTAIAATSTNIICTAMTIDAAALTPVGVALRGIRFNPVPGSQE